MDPTLQPVGAPQPLQPVGPAISLQPAGPAASLQPAGQAQPLTAAAPPAQSQDAELTDNSKGEGLYQMKAPNGSIVGVPFSKVHRSGRGAIDAGYKFANHDEVARYAKDLHAAPTIALNDLMEGIEERPGWRHWLDPTTFVPEQAAGGIKGVATTEEGLRKATGTQSKEPGMAAAMAQRPNQNVQEGAGESQEAMGEFVSGEELLGLVGKIPKALGISAKIAQTLEQSPAAMRVFKVGMNAIKNIPELRQALLGGAQGYAKSGGDTGAAGESALITGLTGLGLRPVAAGLSALGAMIKAPAEAATATEAAAAARQETATANAAAINKAAQAERDAATAAAAARKQAATTNAARINDMAQLERKRAANTNAAVTNAAAQAEREAAAQAAASRHEAAAQNAAAINKAAQAERDAAAAANAARPGTAEYAEQAQEAARPVLEHDNISREVTMAQPGGAPPAATGQRVAIATGRNVESTIATMQDFTGAADRLEEHGQPIYDEFDRVTDGRFRKLNGEVQSAKQAMYSGEKGADELYQQKLRQMEALMDSTQGAMKPEQLAAGKALWTKQYALRDVGDLVDKSIARVPGSTEPAAGADINGNTMLKSLQQLVKRYKGRARVDEILGPGRLDTLEGIAQANTTEAKKQAFQQAFTTVQEQLELLAKAEAAAAKAKGPKFQFEFTSPEQEHQKLLDAEAAAAAKGANKQGFKYEFTTPEEEHDKLLKEEKAAQKAVPKFEHEFTTPEAEHEKLLKAEAEGAGAKPGGKSKTLVHAVGRGAAQLVGAGVARATGLSWYEGMIAGGGAYDSGRLVMKALTSNPKIAQNFLFALQSGATPARFGPLIARMIAQAQQDNPYPEKPQPQETKP